MAKENGLWIPDEVWAMDGYSFTQKGFVAQILALDNKGGCYASNAFFAEKFDLSKDRVSGIINELAKAGVIEVEINRKDKSQRVIKIKDLTAKMPIGKNAAPVRQKCRTGYGENAEGGTAETPLGYGENAEQNIKLIQRENIKMNIKGEGACAPHTPGDSSDLNAEKKKESPPGSAPPPLTPVQKAQRTKAAREKDQTAELVLPFDSPGFRDWWARWLDHKALIKAPYTTRMGEQAALKSLAGFDEDFSILLIQTSIESGWHKLVYDSTPRKWELYQKRKQSNGKENNVGGKSGANGIDFSRYARMVAGSSANPERFGRADGNCQDEACAKTNVPDYGSSDWGYPGEQVKAAG